ncbi:transglycosylase domain-containing protein [soil metagenome]
MINEKTTETRKGKRAVKILWIAVLGGLGFFFLIFLMAMMGVFGKLPSIQELENPQANLASEIYADDGHTLMGKIYAENRSPVDYQNISKNALAALVSTEDERFYEHSGIDIRSIARAVWGLGRDGGGSTITQQLAKNMLGQGKGWIGKRAVDKIKEWIVAVKLERNFTKQEIISLYLNRVPWGNIYGIRNASRTYFQKEPSELNVPEAALLIGMLKGPGQYDPVRHQQAALSRRNVVMDQMVRNDELKEGDAAVFKKYPLNIKFKKLDENVGIAPYFRMVLTKQLVNWCNNHKDPKTGNNYDVYRDGLKIYTTVNPKMQLYAEEAVIMHMSSLQKKFNSQLGKNIWEKHQDILDRAMKESERWRILSDDEKLSSEDKKKSFYIPVKMKIFAWNAKREIDTLMTPMDSIKYLKQMMQTAFSVMDPMTGQVKAWVGGIDYKWFKFDHVTANRQVGSTFKPLLYTLALMENAATPDTYIGGRAITLANKTITGKGGTMAYCLAKSLNAGAYDLMSRIGPKKTAEFAHEAGIKSNIPIVPSIALGSADLTLLEMLHAYTMFPNRGVSTEPISILRIEDKNGNLLENFQPETKQVTGENEAYTMYKMMEGVMDFGTGHAMRDRFNINSPMGGKTGTTNDNTDGWFIGYTPQLLAGTWVGCDDPFLKIKWTNGGNEMAMPEWAYFMQKVYADKTLGIDPKAEFQRPADLDNNPIYADQNFNDIIQRGEGSDEPDDYGNGNADDYQDGHLLSPVESEFNKPTEQDPNNPKKKPATQPRDSLILNENESGLSKKELRLKRRAERQANKDSLQHKNNEY